MSINSPAKLERIERHLMRQRGAGVRTVSASFGFSFGIASVPTSSESTIIAEEPAPKRRKTIVENTFHTSEPDIIRSFEILEPGAPEGIESRKARRRLCFESGTGGVDQVHATDANDTFPGSLNNKRVAAKRSNGTGAVEPGSRVLVAAAESATKCRPKRRAAANAEVKVADGFAEEALPVDKKRRESICENKPKRTRKKQDGVTEVASEPSQNRKELETLGESITIGPVKRRYKTPKTIETEVQASRKDVPIPDQPATALSSEHVLPAKSSKSTSRMRKKDGSITSALHTLGIDDTCRGKQQHDSGNPQIDIASPSTKDFGVVDKKQTKTEKRTKANISRAAEETPYARRHPLRETDMNLTMRSASPEKHFVSEIKPQTRHTASAEFKDTSITECTDDQASKRRKAKHQSDNQATRRGSNDDTFQNEKTVHTRTVQTFSTTSAAKPAEETDSFVDATMHKSRQVKKSKRTNTSKSHHIPMEESAMDENVDWLFENVETKRHATGSLNNARSRRAASQARTKLADIDLDDLLSNIASLAKK